MKELLRLVWLAGGEPITSVDDLHRLLTHVIAAAPLPMRLLRGAEQLDVVVMPEMK